MKGRMTCPICQGTGKITEDKDEYEFQTRDPHTQTCLTCSGTGEVAPRKRLPDGRAVSEIGGKAAPKKQAFPKGGFTGESPANQGEHAADYMPLGLSKSDLKDIFQGLSESEITVKVTTIYLSGTMDNITKLIKEII